jgi:hypothetical protein
MHSGISGAVDLSKLPAHRRPHAVVDDLGELLSSLS